MLKYLHRIHHIGIKVDNIPEPFSPIIEKYYGTENAYVFKDNNIAIEYVKFNKETGIQNGVYHICYEVNNIENTLKHINKGYKKISPVITSDVWKKKIIYLFSKSNGFMELIEK